MRPFVLATLVLQAEELRQKKQALQKAQAERKRAEKEAALARERKERVAKAMQKAQNPQAKTVKQSLSLAGMDCKAFSPAVQDATRKGCALPAGRRAPKRRCVALNESRLMRDRCLADHL